MNEEDWKKLSIVLVHALANCRGVLQEAISGHAAQEDLIRIQKATSAEVLISIVGNDAHRELVNGWDSLSMEEKEMLLGIHNTSDNDHTGNS